MFGHGDELALVHVLQNGETFLDWATVCGVLRLCNGPTGPLTVIFRLAGYVVLSILDIVLESF